MSRAGRFIWPDVIVNPPAAPEDYRPGLDEHTRRGIALSDQLSAWGICMAGGNPGEELPETFGQGMAILAQITGASVPEECESMAKEYTGERT